MHRFLLYIIIVMLTLITAVLLSDGTSQYEGIGDYKEKEEVSVESDSTSTVISKETVQSADELLDEMFAVSDKRVSFGMTYGDAMKILGTPDEQYGEGGETYITYGGTILQFTMNLDEPDGMSDPLIQIMREDLFKTRTNVESVLGYPSDEEYIDEIGKTILTYPFEEAMIYVWVNQEDEVESVRAVQVAWMDDVSIAAEEVTGAEEEEFMNELVEEEEPYDPFYETNQLAAFSKTVQIGDDESVVRAYMGDASWYEETLAVYDSPPVRFIARDGKVAFISWGRSGSFEQWETNEGVGRRSSLADATEAYQGYSYNLLYREGLSLPSYMMVEEGGNVRVFEFIDGAVSFIFLCAPDMLDELFIRNTAFTFDELREEPF